MSVAPGASAPYPKGPLGGRFLAYLIDAINASPLLPLGILLVMAGSVRGEVSIPGLLVSTLATLWMFGYVFGRDVAGGAGPGKRLAGLVVVSTQTGAPASAGATIVRHVVLAALGLIPVIGSLIEPVMVLTDKDGRRLGDRAAKTQVVRSAEVAARGIAVKTSKGAAAGFLAAVLLVSVVGTVFGGVVFVRSAASPGADWEAGVPVPETGIVPDTVPPVETPAAEEPALEAPDTAINEEAAAAAAVSNMLLALQQDDVERARTYATPYFQEAYYWLFYPSSGTFTHFEIVGVYRDAALWEVEVSEEWKSGTYRVFYFVIIDENNQALVDDVIHE